MAPDSMQKMKEIEAHVRELPSTEKERVAAVYESLRFRFSAAAQLQNGVDTGVIDDIDTLYREIRQAV